MHSGDLLIARIPHLLGGEAWLAYEIRSDLPSKCFPWCLAFLQTTTLTLQRHPGTILTYSIIDINFPNLRSKSLPKSSQCLINNTTAVVNSKVATQVVLNILRSHTLEVRNKDNTISKAHRLCNTNKAATHKHLLQGKRAVVMDV